MNCTDQEQDYEAGCRLEVRPGQRVHQLDSEEGGRGPGQRRAAPPGVHQHLQLSR